MLDLEKMDRIACLTLNRPEKHNAFDDAVIASLIAALEDIAADPTIHVVQLAARGKSFCAGGDLHWMKRMAGFSLAENLADARQLGRLMHLLFTLPQPVIGLVQGAAYGGGLGLAACCDLVLATPEARFSLSEVKIGLIPAVISPYVVHALGARRARRLSITAEVFSAQEAQQWGLVDSIHPLEELSKAGEEWATKLLQNAPGAMRDAKKLLRTLSGRPIDETVREESAQGIAERRASAEAQEGLSAFFDKRKPNWID